MKRRLLIFLLLALLVSAGVTAWHFRARLFHGDSSEVFQHYRNTPGIMADYIKNFHLDDSTAISVTILQATDSAAWAQLISDFKIPSEYARIPANIISTGSRLFPKGHPEQTADTALTNNELLVHYRQEKTLYIFHFESEAQFDAVISYKYHQQKKQSSKLIEK